MQVRQARTADAEAIAGIHVRGWQATYRGTFSDAFLDGMDVADRARRWRAALDVPGHDTLVAVADDDRLLGFASVSASRDADADGAAGELQSIYVDPSDWGTGAGRALITAAVDVLHEREFTHATLWVLAGNERAESFYRRAGWHDTGDLRHDVLAGTSVTERRYRREL